MEGLTGATASENMARGGHREGRNQQIPVDERKKSDKGRR